MAGAAMVLLSACNGEKEYTITGTFDLPQSIQMGDTLIERGSLDGVYVYMLDIEGEPLDSALIENETFELKGKVSAENPYFAYLVCEWGAGMMVVEPGNIEVEMRGETMKTTGTPLNDGIAKLDESLLAVQERCYEQMLEMYNNQDSLSQEEMISFYFAEQQQLVSLIDSVYAENSENLIGVFACNLVIGSVSDVEQLDDLLSGYSDYVKNSQLIQSYRSYLESRVQPNLSFDELVPDNNTAE